MSIFKSLFYRLCFWHRNWQLIASKTEVWTQKSKSIFDDMPTYWYFSCSGVDLPKKEETKFNKIVAIEKCQITGFERAFVFDTWRNTKTSIDVAHARVRINNK